MNFLPRPAGKATEESNRPIKIYEEMPNRVVKKKVPDAVVLEDVVEVYSDDDNLVEIVEESANDSSDSETTEFEEESAKLRDVWTKIGKEHGWMEEAENRGYTKAINVMVKALNKHRDPYLDIPLAKRLKTIQDLGVALDP